MHGFLPVPAGGMLLTTGTFVCQAMGITIGTVVG